MRTNFVNFLAYPVVLIAGFFVFKKDNLSVKSIQKHQESKMTFLTSATRPVLYGPNDETFESYTKDLKEYSLATPNSDSFISFREALAFKESQGKYGVVNTLGYLGKYQFGMSTLRTFGVNDSLAFLQSPRLQERVFLKNLKYNHTMLEDYIEMFEGKEVGGVKVTESGILAAAHLSGVGGVKKYLRTNGSGRSRDAYGSSVRGYLKKFGGYDLSRVLD
ncbi:peptidoglycan-binding protein LysM [Nonlabens agnitus]|uniref:peptidoglycan-binding protein LysM n=1 Tax=Nonlabens agnitus TaxID=870484 RepID=UPI000D032B34|nr:peptidoglycan-binding protein LysM [Nonlabens agnitus]